MKILIAEDDVVSRKVLVGHLENWGYEVTESANGDDAWSNYEKGDYEMAVLDWMMPGLDGIELLRRIRQTGRPGYTYVILLSAKSQKDDMVNAIEAGADDYVTKPFDREELRVRVLAGRRILELHSALLRAEKGSIVGQVAMGLSQELSEPIGHIRDILTTLRRETFDLALTAAELQSSKSAQSQNVSQPPTHGATDRIGSNESMPAMCDRSLEMLARVQGTLRNLRDFARADEFVTKPISVGPALEDVAEMVQRLAATKAVAVNLELAEVPHVNGNAGKLKKVVLHLLVNAIDAVERRGCISLRLTHEEGQVVIRVEDNGHGIAAAHLPHIFEPFYALRLPADRRLGLGLAISDAVIREHGGTLGVHSVVDRGTTFTIRLPALPPSSTDTVPVPGAHSRDTMVAT